MTFRAFVTAKLLVICQIILFNLDLIWHEKDLPNAPSCYLISLRLTLHAGLPFAF